MCGKVERKRVCARYLHTIREKLKTDEELCFFKDGCCTFLDRSLVPGRARIYHHRAHQIASAETSSIVLIKPTILLLFEDKMLSLTVTGFVLVRHLTKRATRRIKR